MERYCAFISYRHQSPDMEIAKRLHTLIENYPVPAGIRRETGRRRPGKVFRDQEELPLTADLGKDIEAALDGSEWLIAVCSPRYLESRWCMREVEYFLQKHGRERVLTVLTEGEPGESFPETLCYTTDEKGERIPIEPLAADVRAETLTASLKKLKKEKLRLLAPMLGVSFDGLYQRQRRRAATRALAAAGAAIVALGGFLAYALAQNARIEAQRVTAARNECDLLVEKSIYYTSENRKTEARQLALDAKEVSRTIGDYGDVRIRDALAVTCYAGDFSVEAEMDFPGLVENTACHSFSPDGRLIAAAVSTAEVACCDAMTGERLWVTPPFSQAVSSLAWSPDGSRIAVSSTWGHIVCFLDAKTGERLQFREDIPGGSWPTCTVFRGDRLLVCGSDGLRAYDAEDLTRYALLSDARQRQHDTARVMGGGRWIAWLSDGAGSEIHIHDTDTDAHAVHAVASWINNYTLSPDGEMLYVRAWSTHYVWDLKRGEKRWEKEISTAADYDMYASPVWAEGRIWDGGEVYDAATGEKAYSLEEECFGAVRDYFLCRGGVYRISDGTLYAQAPGRLLAMDETGRHVLVKTETVSKETAPGAGSQYAIEHYGGTLTEIPEYTEPGEDMIRELNDFYGTGAVGTYMPRTYCSPDGRFYIITNTGGYVPVYDLKVSGEPAYRLHEFNGYSAALSSPMQNLPGAGNLIYGPQVAGVAFSPDSRLAAFAGVNGLVAVYELEKGKQLFSWDDMRGGAALVGVKFNADGTLVMAAAYLGKAFRVYSAVNGLTLYAMHAEKEIRDWGFDAETGDAVIVYRDGSALAADIFTTPEELYRYADLLTDR